MYWDEKIGLINRVIRGSRHVIRGQLIFTVMAETTDIIGSESCNIHNASMQHKTLEYPSIYSFKLLIDQKPHKIKQKYPKIQLIKLLKQDLEGKILSSKTACFP